MRALAATRSSLLHALCDDAAIFPPGNLPLAEAVPAHLEHRAGRHRRMVGPFVISSAQLAELGPLVESQPATSFDVSVTVPSPSGVAAALEHADAIAALRVTGIEVSVPEGFPVETVLPSLDTALTGRPETDVFVELPRNDLRAALVMALASTSYLAKLRTGGIRADLYPDEQELAKAIVATVAARVPFKATAGLHHAVRNTDPDTGFEQHGFLNVITAVDAALSGANETQVATLLAERDAATVAHRARTLGDSAEQVRAHFRSFGTCSIDEPAEELTALGLNPTQTATEGEN